jgi:serine/threonine protein kinase
MLTDFGLSKEGVIDNYGAKSFCGSMAYLAPEMLKRVGHGRAVDWYHLGKYIASRNNFQASFSMSFL